MAATYQSISTTAWLGRDINDEISINKPTGLAVGDLMIAHLSWMTDANNSGSDFSSFNGDWTRLGESFIQGSASYGIDVWYKIADAGDVAASNFQWTWGNSDDAWAGGAIYRIDGYGGMPTIVLDSNASGSTPVFTNTNTPLVAGNLLLFLVSAFDFQNSGSVAGYSIATDNPTWTERADVYGNSGGLGAGFADGLMSGATASRSSANATGNSSVTLTTFASQSFGAMIIIPDITDADGTSELVTMTSEVFESENTVGTTASHELLEMPASEVFEPSGRVVERRWADEEKGIGAWNSETKT